MLGRRCTLMRIARVLGAMMSITLLVADAAKEEERIGGDFVAPRLFSGGMNTRDGDGGTDGRWTAKSNEQMLGQAASASSAGLHEQGTAEGHGLFSGMKRDVPWPLGENGPLPYQELQDPAAKAHLDAVAAPAVGLDVSTTPEDMWMYLTMAILPMLDKIALDPDAKDTKVTKQYKKALKKGKIPASPDELKQMKDQISEAELKGGFPVRFADCEAYARPPKWWDGAIPPYMLSPMDEGDGEKEAPPPWCRTGLSNTLSERFQSVFPMPGSLLQLDMDSESLEGEGDEMITTGENQMQQDRILTIVERNPSTIVASAATMVGGSDAVGREPVIETEPRAPVELLIPATGNNDGISTISRIGGEIRSLAETVDGNRIVLDDVSTGLSMLNLLIHQWPETRQKGTRDARKGHSDHKSTTKLPSMV